MIATWADHWTRQIVCLVRGHVPVRVTNGTSQVRVYLPHAHPKQADGGTIGFAAATSGGVELSIGYNVPAEHHECLRCKARL